MIFYWWLIVVSVVWVLNKAGTIGGLYDDPYGFEVLIDSTFSHP